MDSGHEVVDEARMLSNSAESLASLVLSAFRIRRVHRVLDKLVDIRRKKHLPEIIQNSFVVDVPHIRDFHRDVRTAGILALQTSSQLAPPLQIVQIGDGLLPLDALICRCSPGYDEDMPKEENEQNWTSNDTLDKHSEEHAVLREQRERH